jgi:hypothetical protein
MFLKGTIIPVFQNSIVPASFWQNASAKIIPTFQARFILDTTDDMRFLQIITGYCQPCPGADEFSRMPLQWHVLTHRF